MKEDKIEFQSGDGKIRLERNDCTYADNKTDISWILWIDNGYNFEIAGRIDKLYDQEFHKWGGVKSVCS